MTSTALATIDGEIIEETPQPVTLFGTTDPASIVARATALATALADVIEQKNLYKRIGNKNHVLVEGWTLLGSMVGVFAEVEWTRPTDDGWEARAVARTLGGNIVGAAEAMCSKSEGTWRNRDQYAIRSMAQTRAVSKALRLPLGYIIELAGYSATPAEEMDHEPRPTVHREPTARERLAETAAKHKLGLDQIEAYASQIGVEGRATDAQIEQIIALIESPQESTPVQSSGDPASETRQTPPAAPEQPAVERAVAPAGVAPEAGDSPPPASGDFMQQVLEMTGGTEVVEPPRPGTDAFRELDGYGKKNAREYWSKREPKGARETHEAAEVPA
jgi:hypothetical protein